MVTEPMKLSEWRDFFGKPEHSFSISPRHSDLFRRVVYDRIREGYFNRINPFNTNQVNGFSISCSDEADVAELGISKGSCSDVDLTRDLFGDGSECRKDQHQRGDWTVWPRWIWAATTPVASRAPTATPT